MFFFRQIVVLFAAVALAHQALGAYQCNTEHPTTGVDKCDHGVCDTCELSCKGYSGWDAKCDIQGGIVTETCKCRDQDQPYYCDNEHPTTGIDKCDTVCDSCKKSCTGFVGWDAKCQIQGGIVTETCQCKHNSRALFLSLAAARPAQPKAALAAAVANQPNAMATCDNNNPYTTDAGCNLQCGYCRRQCKGTQKTNQWQAACDLNDPKRSATCNCLNAANTPVSGIFLVLAHTNATAQAADQPVLTCNKDHPTTGQQLCDVVCGTCRRNCAHQPDNKWEATCQMVDNVPQWSCKCDARANLLSMLIQPKQN